ncbi:hypothetical protein K7432_002601 [Basidiobolus ranarum]|uniref:BRCT domain-containing protein n=1 Tax=Basidiobolus ranarum TaxID=34480 RepID=A0ABR2W8E2_9FUNG
MEYIFDNMTAWFAPSVPLEYRKLWVENGGKIQADYKDPGVEYLFSQSSEDAQIEDLLQQGDMLVFSSEWIQRSMKVGYRLKLGKFLLFEELLSSQQTTEQHNEPLKEQEFISTTQHHAKIPIELAQNEEAIGTPSRSKRLRRI